MRNREFRLQAQRPQVYDERIYSRSCCFSFLFRDCSAAGWWLQFSVIITPGLWLGDKPTCPFASVSRGFEKEAAGRNQGEVGGGRVSLEALQKSK